MGHFRAGLAFAEARIIFSQRSPARDYARLLPQLEPVDLPVGMTIHIAAASFPYDGRNLELTISLRY